jgi:hypothetical protein
VRVQSRILLLSVSPHLGKLPPISTPSPQEAQSQPCLPIVSPSKVVSLPGCLDPLAPSAAFLSSRACGPLRASDASVDEGLGGTERFFLASGEQSMCCLKGTVTPAPVPTTGHEDRNPQQELLRVSPSAHENPRVGCTDPSGSPISVQP